MLNGNHSLGQFLQKSKKIVLGMSLATTMGIALPSVSMHRQVPLRQLR